MHVSHRTLPLTWRLAACSRCVGQTSSCAGEAQDPAGITAARRPSRTQRAMALARWTGAVPPAVLGLYCQLLSTLFVAVMALVAKVAGRRYGIPGGH